VSRTARAIGIVLTLGACRSDPGAGSRPATGDVIYDHHVHLLSPVLVHDWKSLGVPFTRPDSAYTSADLLLDGDGTVAAAVLVPMAHLYGNRGFRDALGLDEAGEYARVRGENDHVARDAGRHPGRAVALCSVPVLRPYALTELGRCRDSLRAAGVKLHLAASEVDLRREEDLQRLADIMAWADQRALPVLLHFDPQQRGLEVEDVERFITRVLAPHPGVELYLAHLGGSGGYGAWTRSVFGVFTEWLAREPEREVFLEVSSVLLERESEGVPPTTPGEAAAFARDLRRFGLGRVVFGSDYPVFDPVAYRLLLTRLGTLTAEEVTAITSNRGTLLDPR